MTKLLTVITNPAIKNTIGDPTRGGFSLADSATIPLLFIKNFLTIGFIIGSVGFLFMLLWGAVEYVTAGGEKEKVGNASKRITSALVGLILLFAVFAIMAIVQQVFGITLLNLTIPVI